MMQYRLTDDGLVVTVSDGANIPNDPNNRDRAEYEAWLANGNAPYPYVAPPLSAADVNAVRDARLAVGFADAVIGKTWQCDEISQGKWTALGASAGLALALQISPPPTFEMIAADNSTVDLSAAATFELINGRLLPWVSATMLYARAIKNQIGDGTPPADITAGWP